MKTREWLTRLRSGTQKSPSEDRDALNAEARAAHVQKTFEAVAMVGFLKFRNEELGLGLRVTEGDRKEYFKVLEESYRPDYEAILATASDAKVQEALQWWIKKAETMGITEWQREQESNGREM